ncbi:MAG: hypothetical protein R3A51_23790, partial [Nannocystaceae bacterium]
AEGGVWGAINGHLRGADPPTRSVERERTHRVADGARGAIYDDRVPRTGARSRRVGEGARGAIHLDEV